MSVCSAKKMSLKGSEGSRLPDWRKRVEVSNDLPCLMTLGVTLEVTHGVTGGTHIMMNVEAAVVMNHHHHHLLPDHLMMTAALLEGEEVVAVGIQDPPPHHHLTPHLQEAVAVNAIIT